MACQELGVDATVGVGVGVAEECWGRLGQAGGEGEAWGRALPRRSMGRWARVASESEAGPDGGHSGAGEGRAGRCGR